MGGGTRTVLFNAVVLFWVTRTDSRDMKTSSSTARSKSDSARSRVTRLSFYTGWLRANMGQGPHPGRPFLIPPTPPPHLMGGGNGGGGSDGIEGVNVNNDKAVGDSCDAAASSKADGWRASVTTEATAAIGKQRSEKKNF